MSRTGVIQMRTHCDCMVASLAMLMGWTYEQAAQYFPPKAVSETGYDWQPLVRYLQMNKIYLRWFRYDMLNEVDWTRPAMLDVPSLINPDLGDHIIYWDGERVIDPSTKGQRYTERPEQIFNVYQRIGNVLKS